MWFVICRGVNVTHAIQICAELYDSEAKQRKMSNLIEAMDRFSLPKGLIITENDECNEIVEINDKI